MRIWQPNVSLEKLNQRGEGTLSDFLDITFTELGDDFLKATMLVIDKHKQPVGFLHGGANVVLAETIASTAANAVIDLTKNYCVGLEINANHLRSVKSGMVTAETTPFHIGKSTHIWHILITDENGKKTCVSRMTASVLERR